MKTQSLRKCLIFLTILTLLEIGLTAYLGIWREGFWNAVENKHTTNFFVLLGYFSAVALTLCATTGYQQYLVTYSALIMRTRLTKKALKAPYEAIPGGSQRVQEDCCLYPRLLISLTLTFAKSTLLIGVFTTIVIVQLNLSYVLLSLLYATLGTIVAAKLAKPLINLNYINQNYEAAFRQLLTRVNYIKAHRNNFYLMKTTKHLSYFQSFYGQVTVILPYVMGVPLYFAGTITFGVVMQVASSINHIIDNLSMLIYSFNDINLFISCRRRLKELKII